MPSFRRLSGADVVRILRDFGFEIMSQRGSHAKLRRVAASGAQQTLHVPLHRELDTGTCRAIFRQACAFIPESELAPHFQNI